MTALATLVNLATEFKTSVWAWVGVAGLTVGGVVLGEGIKRLPRRSEGAWPAMGAGPQTVVNGSKSRVKVINGGGAKSIIATGVVVILGVMVGAWLIPANKSPSAVQSKAGEAWTSESENGDSNTSKTERLPFHVAVLTDPRDARFGDVPGRPEDYVFPSGRVPSLPAPEPVGQCFDWQRWAERLGGVRSYITNVAFTVSALGDEVVRVHSARLSVERHPGPARGDRVSCTQGGPIPVSHLEIDLDNETATYAYPTEGGNGAARPFALQVDPGRSERVAVKAISRECYCSWYLDLQLESGGIDYSYRVNDQGVPFVTAPLAGDYVDYVFDTTTHRWRPGIG